MPVVCRVLVSCRDSLAELRCSFLAQTSSQTFMVNTDPVTRGTFVQNGTMTNQIMAPPHIIGGYASLAKIPAYPLI